jgi:hypothetical protein
MMELVLSVATVVCRENGLKIWIDHVAGGRPDVVFELPDDVHTAAALHHVGRRRTGHWGFILYM